MSNDWPDITLSAWEDTRVTLHMWTQVVGKVRLALAPMMNHWWQVPLYVSARGLTTSLMHSHGRGLEMEFDFVDHVLGIRTTDGDERRVALEPRTVASFYDATMRHARRRRDAGVDSRPARRGRGSDSVSRRRSTPLVRSRRGQPLLARARRVPPRDDDLPRRVHRQGEPRPLLLGWRRPRGDAILGPDHAQASRRCPELRGLRAGARVQPRGEQLRLLARRKRGGIVLCVRIPRTRGLRDWSVRPDDATYDATLGEFLLPYRAVRTAADPDASVLAFFADTYAAVAELAAWPRAELEVADAR